MSGARSQRRSSSKPSSLKKTKKQEKKPLKPRSCGSINGYIALTTMMPKRVLAVRELRLTSLTHLFPKASMYKIVWCFGFKDTDWHVHNFLKFMLQETTVWKYSLPLEIWFLIRNLIVLTFHRILSHSLKPASGKFRHLHRWALSLWKATMSEL